jgi:MSHA biogenesis protein MshO
MAPSMIAPPPCQPVRGGACCFQAGPTRQGSPVNLALRISKQRGVTLVELVVTIVLMGILAGGTVAFVISSTQSYVDTATRSQLSAIGRIATQKLEQAIRLAVPNSIRVTTADSSGNQCLEYLPIADVSSYLSVNFASASNSLTTIPFTASGLSGKKYAVIFPITPAALYGASSPGPLATITNYTASINADIETVTLSTSHLFYSGSAAQRLYLANEPVSFCVQDGKLFRYKNYTASGLKSTQCTPATSSCFASSAPNRALIADSISNASRSAFSVASSRLQSTGSVRLDLNFADGTEAINIRHEIQVTSAP